MKKISLTYKSELSTLLIVLMLLFCCGCDTVSDKSQMQLSYASDKKSQSMDTNNNASDESQGSDDTITGFFDFDNDGTDDTFRIYYFTDETGVKSRKAEITFGDSEKASVNEITESNDKNELYVYPQNKISFIPSDSGVIILQNAFCPFKKPLGNTVILYFYDGSDIHALKPLYDNITPSGRKDPLTIEFMDESRYTLNYTYENVFTFDGIVSDELLANSAFDKNQPAALGGSEVVSIDENTGRVIMRIAVCIGGQYQEAYLDITFDFDAESRIYTAADASYSYGLTSEETDFSGFDIDDTVYTA